MGLTVSIVFHYVLDANGLWKGHNSWHLRLVTRRESGCGNIILKFEVAQNCIMFQQIKRSNESGDWNFLSAMQVTRESGFKTDPFGGSAVRVGRCLIHFITDQTSACQADPRKPTYVHDGCQIKFDIRKKWRMVGYPANNLGLSDQTSSQLKALARYGFYSNLNPNLEVQYGIG